MRPLIRSTLFLFVAVSTATAQDADAEKKAIAKIRESGALVLEIAQNDNRLDVSFLTAQGKVTDELLMPIKDLTRLAHLNLRGTEITDAGLVQIAKQKTLVRLHLEKSKITDKGLEQLKELENLEYLNLYGTEITDAGLVHLEGLKKLKSLYLWQTKVTDEGVKKLQAALPGLKIIRGT
jgi:translation elongation factor EF-Tu-like GTPase